MNTVVKSKKLVAQDTYAFLLEKPTGFNFQSGQYITVTVSNPPVEDPNGNSRYFSIANNPTDKELLIIFRGGSSLYKKQLQALAEQSILEINGPEGSFVLDQSIDSPLVLFAGGVGITPLYSMILSALENTPNRQIFLFYSNQTPQTTVLLPELEKLAEKYHNFKVISTMTRISSGNAWQGLAGRFTKDQIFKDLQGIDTPIYYVVGSHQFVTGIMETLQSLGVSKGKIIREAFCGYCPDHDCCCDLI